MPLTSVIVSDINYPSKNNQKVEERLKRMLLWAEKNQTVSDVFIMGDILNEQIISPMHAEQHLEKISSLLNKINTHTSVLAGDQDVKHAPKYKIEHYFNKTQGIRHNFIGLDSSWEEFKGKHGKIDTTLFKQNTQIPKDPIILTHHPITPWDLSNNSQYNNKEEKAYAINKEDIWKNVITKINPKLIINGHLQQQRNKRYKGIPIFSTDPFYTPQKDQSTFYTVNQTKDKTIIKEHLATEEKIIEDNQTYSYPSKTEQNS